MTGCLVDTNVLIDVLRDLPGAARRLRQARGAGVVYGSVVSRAEVLAGMREGETSATYGLLRAVDWVEVDAAVADLAGAFSRRHRNSTPGIGIADYLIAATAAVAGVPLLTRNVRHFPMFEGLRPAY